MNRCLMTCAVFAFLLASRSITLAETPAATKPAMAVEQVEYAKLLPYQFEQRFKKCPLAYVPVGSLEWHGEHLCLGTDAIKAEDLCCRAARQGGGIVLPAVYLGVLGMTGWGEKYNDTIGNKGLFNVEPDLLKRILTAELENLDRLGFKGAVIITGHYPQEQVDLVKQVAAAFQPKHGLKVVATTDRDMGRAAGHTGDHAAKWETSLIMAQYPALVDLSRLSKDPNQKPEGVFGDDPRTTASVELGQKTVDALVDDLCKLGDGLLKP